MVYFLKLRQRGFEGNNLGYPRSRLVVWQYVVKKYKLVWFWMGYGEPVIRGFKHSIRAVYITCLRDLGYRFAKTIWIDWNFDLPHRFSRPPHWISRHLRPKFSTFTSFRTHTCVTARIWSIFLDLSRDRFICSTRNKIRLWEFCNDFVFRFDLVNDCVQNMKNISIKLHPT